MTMSTITPARADGLSIGELSRLVGLNIETIRYYERIKMLPAPRRTRGGHRVFGTTEMRTLAFIRRARELGFTLYDIRALLDLGGPRASCAEVHKIASCQLERVRAKRKDLAELDRLLARTIAKCSRATDAACPVIEVLDSTDLGNRCGLPVQGRSTTSR
jgi:MerR family transcriptional regulator, mercuric resistance operon regulatory protein